MLKFIIFAVLFIYIIFKASNFVFRLIYKIGGIPRPEDNPHYFNNRAKSNNGQYRKRPAGSNVDVEYTRSDDKKSGRKNSDDGEYVDYEEVK